jgi:hypothetical protein
MSDSFIAAETAFREWAEMFARDATLRTAA